MRSQMEFQSKFKPIHDKKSGEAIWLLESVPHLQYLFALPLSGIRCV